MIGGGNLGRKPQGYQQAPHLLAAGKKTTVEDESVAACMNPTAEAERPGTPPEIAKFRRSQVHQVGVQVKHYGTAEDKIPHPEDQPFGIKGLVQGPSLGEAIKNYPESELMQMRLQLQEEVYQTSKREPLGTAALRGHKLPPGLGTEKAFGTVIGAKGMDKNPLSKELIYPVDAPDEESERARELYLKSHMSFGPGEQRRRQYDWNAAGINPDDHKFGAVDKDTYKEGVAKALNPTLDENYKHASTIVTNRLERFKLSNTDELGRPKPLGHGNTGLPQDHTFGKPARAPGQAEWGARKAMVGDYSEEQQRPDADLGKSIRPGFRNLAPDEEKVFGVPSVRVDIGKRVAHQATHQMKDGMTVDFSKAFNDNTNYGEEPDAGALMYPCPASDRGVTEELYMRPYTKEKLKAFLESAGVGLNNFDQFFEQACEVDNFPSGAEACIFTYRKVKRYHESQQFA